MIYKSRMMVKILEKYKINNNDKITIKLLNRISKKEKIEMRDLRYIFQIDNTTMWRLSKNKQHYTELKFDKINSINKKEIIKQGRINLNEFKEIMINEQMRPYTVIKKLGISRYSYNKLKNGEKNHVRTTDVEKKHIVDLIKIDFKYLEEDRYYKLEELKSIVEEYGISIEDFIKYFGENEKHYELNKRVLKENNKGIWMGRERKIQKSFMTKYYEKLVEKIRYKAYIITNITKTIQYREDLIQDAIAEIFAKCGNIVKKFEFDINLTLNILAVKAKYIMLNICRKKYKKENFHYHDMIKMKEDHNIVLADQKYNPENLFS